MKSKLATSFSSKIEDVFPCIVFSTDFKSWSTDKKLYDVNNHFDGDVFLGFDTLFGIDSREVLISSIVTYFRENEEVRYISSSATFDDGEKLQDLPTFPYDEIAVRNVFIETEIGCDVVQEIYLKPRGIVGWLACKLYVLPYLKKQLRRDYESLNHYLASAP